jgi:hypothetical protein
MTLKKDEQTSLLRTLSAVEIPYLGCHEQHVQFTLNTEAETLVVDSEKVADNSRGIIAGVAESLGFHLQTCWCLLSQDALVANGLHGWK